MFFRGVGTVVHSSKSKLDLYIDTLRDLALNGSLHFSSIMYKEKIDGLTLKKHLEFLVQKNLVEKRAATKTETQYFITEQGKGALKWFSKIKKELKLPVSAPNYLWRLN